MTAAAAYIYPLWELTKEATMEKLKQEHEYYLANKAEIDSQYPGKAIVIKNNTVIGIYSSRIEAVEKTQREHEPGTFLVQICGPEGDTPLVFHSRVAFP